MISEQLALKYKYYKFAKNKYAEFQEFAQKKDVQKKELLYVFDFINKYKTREKEILDILCELEFEQTCNVQTFYDFLNELHSEELHILDPTGGEYYIKIDLFRIFRKTLTIEDFYTGKFDNKRVRDILVNRNDREFIGFSSCISELKETKIHIHATASPSIGKFLEVIGAKRSLKIFNDRGSVKENKKKYLLKITDNMTDIAEMSMRGIKTCQSWDDTYNAFTNLIDKNMCIAYAENQNGHWQVRAILRRMKKTDGKVIFFLETVYGQEYLKGDFIKLLNKHIEKCGYELYSNPDMIDDLEGDGVSTCSKYEHISSGFVYNVNTKIYYPFLDYTNYEKYDARKVFGKKVSKKRRMNVRNLSSIETKYARRVFTQ